jgi:autotransporter translocation and assembly factor TamB
MRLDGWRGFLVICLLLMISVAAVTLFLNRGSIPAILARQAITLIEARWPVHVHIGQARFEGPTHLVIDQVVLTPKPDGPFTEPITVDQVHLRFGLFALLDRDPLEALRQVVLVSPRLTVDFGNSLHLLSGSLSSEEGHDTSPQDGENAGEDNSKATDEASVWPDISVAVRKGQIVWSGANAPDDLTFDVSLKGAADTLRIQDLRVSRGAGRLSGSGELDVRGRLTAHVRLLDWLAADLCKYSPMIEVEGSGTVGAELVIQGPWRSPELRGQASLHGAKLISSQWPFETPLPLTEGQMIFSVMGRTWSLESITLLSATGRVVGKGQIERGELTIELTANTSDLLSDVPYVEAWGADGTAVFTGALGGDLFDPELSGDVVLRDGTLWNEAVTEAQGRIRLSRDDFRFSDVRVRSGESYYAMEGSVSAMSSAQTPVLSMDLEADQGRIEQLFAVLGIGLETTGRLDGAMSFAGPLSAVVSGGDVRLTDLEFLGEYVPRAEGAFSWSDGEVRLNDVHAYCGEGLMVVDGSVAGDGSSMQLRVDVTDWPLETIRYARLGSGLLSWSGELGGSFGDPYVVGDLLLRDVQFGKGRLRQLEGVVRYDGHDLESSGLKAVTEDGGTWWMSGRISDINSERRLAIDVRVSDQSLSSLLAMGGHKIPAALIDGAVHGTVEVEGTADNPKALLQLRLTEREAWHEEALELHLQIADRRVKILRLRGA